MRLGRAGQTDSSSPDKREADMLPETRPVERGAESERKMADDGPKT